jgi:hypothetical protein
MACSSPSRRSSSLLVQVEGLARLIEDLRIVA